MSAEDKRAQVLEYLKQHNLQAILAQALNKVLTDLPNNPVDALCEQIQALSKAPTAAVESDEIVILHFNDVYEIEARAREPVGGASRFSTLLKQFAHEEPLILFSGDAFNPSMMSTVTKGKHMVPVLNCFNIHTACFGNHDFDFGVENLEQLAHDTNFPWLISNVFDATTGRPLAGGEASRLVEWRGHKIGLVGLVEEEWLVTLATISMDEVRYVDFVDEGRRLARQLKAQGAQLVIALSHMRQPNDERLVAEATEIDLVLGGHDGWLRLASTLSDDTAPSASLDHLEAQAAPTHPRAPPGPLGSSPWPQELASGWPKAEDVPLSTARHYHVIVDGESVASIDARDMSVIPDPPFILMPSRVAAPAARRGSLGAGSSGSRGPAAG